MLIDLDRVIALARDDFEFTRETRYLNGAIALTIGDKSTALTFSEGKLVGTSRYPEGRHHISVGGTEAQWEELLKDKPLPFYQCIQSAAVKHGMQVSTTDETFAYLPALNRLTVLMRNVRNGRA
ncbi:MAG: hypothetical protein AB7V46_02900 [Thermomicrobiales bacterium]